MSKTALHWLLTLSTIALLLYVAGLYGWVKHDYLNGTKLGSKYQSTLEEGINFSNANLPKFVESVLGISSPEKWGRWTNANAGLTTIKFENELPSSFVLELIAFSYGDNDSKPTKIIIGKAVREIIIRRDIPATYQIVFEGIKDERQIEIRPPLPKSPNQINPNSSDGRKLGIGLISLKILNQPKVQ
jgi:phosphoglycerol transferase